MFQKLLKITQTECLLATHGLKVAEYMQLSNQGALLIIKLYTELPIKKLSGMLIGATSDACTLACGGYASQEYMHVQEDQ